LPLKTQTNILIIAFYSSKGDLYEKGLGIGNLSYLAVRGIDWMHNLSTNDPTGRTVVPNSRGTHRGYKDRTDGVALEHQ
jgi:hypothetical protein